MLIAVVKPELDILPLAEGKKVLGIVCTGCRDVYFPENDVIAMHERLRFSSPHYMVVESDYVCSIENLELYLQKYKNELEDADIFFVFSCGVGVQTIAERLSGYDVYTACDTYPLPGFQGLTPLEFDCHGCDSCHLNMTAGICPITTCSKSLINGECGGAKNGKCEVHTDTDCGWELIVKRLNELHLLQQCDMKGRTK